jgi:hypothetical protein
MKIKYAIVGSNLNPLYIDFWPVVSKVWKTIFNITPVLALICDEDSDFIEDEYGLIKKFKSIDNIDTGLQSQIVRFYITKFLDDNCVISDIDMIPLSRKYFINQVDFFDDNKLYVMSSDNYECLNNKEYPMCYNIANPSKFIEILDLNCEWSEFVNRLNNRNQGWSTDQKYLFEKIQQYNNKEEIVLLSRGWTYGPANHRIDRLYWNYNPSLVNFDYYIDSHLLRPYKQHKEEVDKLVNLLS